jgi:hypothetical protein
VELLALLSSRLLTCSSSANRSDSPSQLLLSVENLHDERTERSHTCVGHPELMKDSDDPWRDFRLIPKVHLFEEVEHPFKL